MTEAVSFQTRARTIDHLGREQIADVPTAVSELWKNAYDAYARTVSLHIYSADPPTAAIYDDGTGMSRSAFVDKWLVVGTESKVDDRAVSADQRQGLPERPRQGQKGIGRLSVAALGSVVLVVSKQADARFIACLVDWRLFENPYIFLHDIKLPVVEFDRPEELEGLVENLRTALRENLTGSDDDPARRDRLVDAWVQFDELDQGRTPGNLTSARIRAALAARVPYEAHLADWPVWTGDRPSGTALVMTELNSALTAWTLEGEDATSEEAGSIRDSLVRTLTGFSDPYAPAGGSVMDYGVVVHQAGPPTTPVSREEGYGIDFLKSLDQYIEGHVDETGIFRGTVRAFGKDLGEVELVPAQAPPTTGRDRIGPFDIAIGTFEGERQASVLDPDVYREVVKRAETHSGLSIYRDGLRVMPYGRPENDFFKIEERRQMHAGREFWASRRMFGRIAITRADNPNLRDKAGREGLIDNSASRAIQLLVKDILRTTARRYFGSDSTYRKELLPGILADNEAAAAKSKKARSQQLANFRKALRSQTAALQAAFSTVATIVQDLDAAVNANDADGVWSLAPRIDEAVSIRADLRLPPKPRNLGNFEEQYRGYRDLYSSVANEVEELRTRWTEENERLNPRPPVDVARSHLGRNQKAVTDRLSGWKRAISALLKSESVRIDAQIDQDMKAFYKDAAPLLVDVEAGRTSLRTAIEEMDELRDRLTSEFSEVYEPYLRALGQLSVGVDLEGAFAYAGARESTLERRLEQIQGLAQIGISVEILSHELGTLDRRLATSLSDLAKSAPPTPALGEAQRAGSELVERLRFLSRIQVSGGDERQTLSGEDIVVYLKKFFGPAIEERGIDLSATLAFRSARFMEFPSRIFPVFINIVNNSLYWLAGRPVKEILLDAVDGKLLIGDTGPGVDKDDQGNLFELFFTRRIRGRGVGLYLCRQTLAAGGHRIEYVPDGPLRRLPGANFAITLRNGFDG
ncbi:MULTISPECIES: ATP-binding protein [Sphingomonas]|uniref:Sensor histidine kinase n=1 Tax=Sphingomonas molluscorum TaxID=418184 RepID=A0ABU8Q1W1_9SPHN|nr:sensor histidine kinase [Sphingomonas sp. JUb134]MBM7405092.1 signal transduction histidine kinase [Sphingomonas sp. JUb134]